MLEPGTSYEVQIGLPGQSPVAGISSPRHGASSSRSRRRSRCPPARATSLSPSRRAAAPSGYVVYQADPAGTTIDVQNASPNNVTISAPYVILRGFTLKGAQARRDQAARRRARRRDREERHQRLGPLIARPAAGSSASTMTPACAARCVVHARARRRSSATRSTIRATARTAGIGHPAGPQGITLQLLRRQQRASATTR